MNPKDMDALQVDTGDRITITNDLVTFDALVRQDPDCPPGVIYGYRPVALGGLEHRAHLEPLHRLSVNPLPVNVRTVVSESADLEETPARKRASFAAG
jgi:hypothetical protein